MNKTETLTLLNGKFNDNEAKELLLNFFATEINFQDLKNYSSIIHSGSSDAMALKRIPELQNSIQQLNKILRKAKSQNKLLVIQSEINITLIDKS